MMSELAECAVTEEVNVEVLSKLLSGDDMAMDTTAIHQSDNITANSKKRSLANDDESEAEAVTKKRRGRPAKPSTSVHHKPRSIAKSAVKGTVKIDSRTVVDACTQTESSHDQVIGWGDIQPDDAATVNTALSSTIMSCIEALIMPVSSHVNLLQKEMDEMKTAVTQLTSAITAFTKPDINIPSATASTSDVSSDNEQDTDFIPASAASRRAKRRSRRHDNDQRPPNDPKTSHPGTSVEPQVDLRRDVVAGMYVDMELKQRRARNIIVSGVPYSNDDFSYVTNLIAEEFDLHYIPTVMCRRIGRQTDGRIQPLLVTLESSEDAAYFVANARLLRRSHDQLVRQHVYVSADLTPAEAKAAYEIRCRRRERNDRIQRADPTVSDVTAGDGRH